MTIKGTVGRMRVRVGMHVGECGKMCKRERERVRESVGEDEGAREFGERPHVFVFYLFCPASIYMSCNTVAEM